MSVPLHFVVKTRLVEVVEGLGEGAALPPERVLAKEFGVRKFPTFNDGDNVYVNSLGQRSTYSDTGPLGTAPPDPLILGELTQAVVQLDQMST